LRAIDLFEVSRKVSDHRVVKHDGVW